MHMNDCCQKYDSRFCPECGKRIVLGGDVAGRLLIFLEGRVKLAGKKRAARALRDLAPDHCAVTSAKESEERWEAWAKWVREAIQREHAAKGIRDERAA